MTGILISAIEELLSAIGEAEETEPMIEPIETKPGMDFSLLKELHMTPPPKLQVKREFGDDEVKAHLWDVFAYPLNEPDLPTLQASVATDERMKQIYEIVDYLDVEDAAHKRYKHEGGTKCNIYAYDFCYLTNAYIPRVWWTKEATEKIVSGQNVQPMLYKEGFTAFQVRVNNLYRWFLYYSRLFGWEETETLEELQKKANDGYISVIVAQNKDMAKPGHICIVLPEIKGDATKQAGWGTDGQLKDALISEAGAKNNKCVKSHWWLMSTFNNGQKLYKFYHHD